MATLLAGGCGSAPAQRGGSAGEFVDNIAKYRIRYPSGWEADAVEGRLFQLSKPSSQSDSTHVSINVRVEKNPPTTYAKALLNLDLTASMLKGFDGLKLDETDAVVAGRRARWLKITYPLRNVESIPDWCAGCRRDEIAIDWSSSILLSAWVDGEQGYSAADFQTAVKIVESIEQL